MHGTALVVLDQAATIGALPVAVARALRTDVRNAYIIADAARTVPHVPRRVDVGNEALAELDVLVGHDDLAAEATGLPNRIRGLVIAHRRLTRGNHQL